MISTLFLDIYQKQKSTHIYFGTERVYLISWKIWLYNLSLGLIKVTVQIVNGCLTHWGRDFFAARFPSKRAILGVFRKILPPKKKIIMENYTLL